MPNYKTHISAAIVCYYIILFAFIVYGKPIFDLNHAISWLLSIVAGSMFPDIDIKSKGQKLFSLIFLFGIIISTLFKNYNTAIGISIFSFMPLLVKHRGLFHNLWFLMALVFIISKILIYKLPDYEWFIISNAIFFAIGIKTHIALDLGIIKFSK